MVDEINESVVGLQKCRDPLSQLEIAIAFAVENSTAARGVMMACSLKENGSARAAGPAAWRVAPEVYKKGILPFNAPFAPAAVEKIRKK